MSKSIENQYGIMRVDVQCSITLSAAEEFQGHDEEPIIAAMKETGLTATWDERGGYKHLITLTGEYVALSMFILNLFHYDDVKGTQYYLSIIKEVSK